MLEDLADLIAIGAHRRPVIVVLGVVPLVLVVVARQAAPDDSLVEEPDEPLEVARVEGCGERFSVARHTVMLRRAPRVRHIGYTD